MTQVRGYTLVELLVIISILAVVISFGLSAFGKARERQVVQSVKELILSVLQNAQKAAYVGDKDCDGSLLGIQVTVGASSLSSQAKCAQGTEGALFITDIPDATFNTSPVIIFRPLEQGIELDSGTSADIIYTIEGSSYHVVVSPPGTIKYEGEL